MIESIEGKRGLPRHRPPYVAEIGLFGRPTLTNNLETLYWIRDIIENGPLNGLLIKVLVEKRVFIVFQFPVM